MNMEAETAVTQPQVEGSPEPLDSGGDKEEGLPTGPGARPRRHLEFSLLTSGSVRRTLCCSEPRGDLSRQPQETNRAVNLISNRRAFMIEFQSVRY